MHLSQLRYAVKLAEYKSFSLAAERMFVTQPTLSQQIKLLEEEMGAQLFVRGRQSVQPSKAGAEFVAQAGRILEQIALLDDLMDKYRSPIEGELSIGLLWTFGYLRLDEYIQHFSKAYPLIDISLSIQGTAQLRKQLMANELDIAFINGKQNELQDSPFQFQKISESEICAMMHKDHPLAARTQVCAEDMAGESILMTSKEANIYEDIKNALQGASIPPKVIGSSGQIDVCAQFAAAGLGISFVSREMADWYSHYNVKAVPLSPSIKRNTYLIYCRNHQRNTVQTFLNYLESQGRLLVF